MTLLILALGITVGLVAAYAVATQIAPSLARVRHVASGLGEGDLTRTSGLVSTRRARPHGRDPARVGGPVQPLSVEVGPAPGPAGSSKVFTMNWAACVT